MVSRTVRPQGEVRRELLADNAAVTERISAAATGLSADQLARRPAPEKWGIAEILEHLCVSTDSYLTTLDPLLAREDLRPAHDPTPWKPTFVGRMLADSMSGERRLPAPRIWRPQTPRSQVLAELVSRHQRIEALLRRSQAVSWQHTKLSSPISKLIRMNIGDAFTVLVRHAERHTRQMEALRRGMAG